MLRVDGYRTSSRIHASDQSEVYLGIREADGLEVVLKLYRDGPSQSRARHEFEILQRIRSEHIARAVELRPHETRLLLVVERFAGISLRRYLRDRSLGPDVFLRIATAATRALAAVHDARIIHKDIKLDNVLIRPESLEVCLIDFGISREFGRADRSGQTGTAEGSLFYLAPEQTGKTGLGVDFRTDLYSLGACFYQLLTGKPPFESDNPIDLITAHIAVRPRSPADVNRRVPIALSRIVDKLLEKDPQLRYQTARGLAADLELCQKQLQTEGYIEEAFILGAEDGSDRLRFSNRVYGRERERAVLEDALQRVANKQIEIALISGPAGIGKSTLVGALRKSLARRSGYLAEAGFDPALRERPYAGFRTALGGLVDQLAAESADRVEHWGQLLRREMGAFAAPLLELTPLLSVLLGESPPLEPVKGERARERIALAVLRFVSALARPAHPLVLFLDDLQWADPGSLFLLKTLLHSNQPESLLVIGAFRDGEVEAEHPLRALLDEWRAGPLPVHEMPLSPFGVAETAALLSDALGRPPEETRWLAEQLGPKSQHNPLILRRLLFHLWDRDLIRYEHGSGWVWDAQALVAAEITEDAAALVAARLHTLPAPTQELLRVASLVGRDLEVETLAELTGQERGDVLQRMMELVDEGVLAPSPDGFKFAHDRLREAGRGELEPEACAALHHRAAQILMESSSLADLPRLAFRLSEHLRAAFDRIEPAERPHALEVFRLAATQSLDQGASESADVYARLALRLLTEEAWAEHASRALEVTLLGAESALQCLDFERALELLGPLEARRLPPLQRSRIIAKRLAVYSLAHRERAVPEALQALRTFKLRWPLRPSMLRTRLATWHTDWLLRGPVEKMFPAPNLRQLDWLAPIAIIGASTGPFAHHDNRLNCLGTAYVVRCFRRHGALGGVAYGLAGYAAQRVAVTGDPRGTRRYAHAIEHWKATADDARAAARCEVVLQAFVQTWLRPRREVLTPLEQMLERAQSRGELEWSAYIGHQLFSIAALSGETLRKVDRRARTWAEHELDRRGPRSYELFEISYGALRGSRSGKLDVERGRSVLEARSLPNSEVFAGVHWIAALFLMGQYDDAAEELNRLWPRVRRVGFGSLLVDYALYRGLCHAVELETEKRRWRRWRHARGLARSLRRIRLAAREGPDFVHMGDLLQAEQHAAAGRTAPALRAYLDAARRAERCGYIHHAALAHERRARRLLQRRRGREAHAALIDALGFYRSWGARAKERQLDAQLDSLGLPRSARADARRSTRQRPR